MGRTTQRQGLIATNMANVNVPGYKRQDVDFGVAIQGVEGPARDRYTSLAQRVNDRVRTSEGSVRVDENSVDVEQEVVALAETELRFQALADLASRHFSGLKTVIREGR